MGFGEALGLSWCLGGVDDSLMENGMPGLTVWDSQEHSLLYR